MSVFTLESILSLHRNVLVLDASSTVVHGGWLQADQPARWVQFEGEASSGVFAVLDALAISPNAAGAFIYCEGPGSILGIRTVATALRTWVALQPRPIFAYRSLELVAAANARPGLTVICDARRQTWHTVTLDDHAVPGPVQRLPTAELPDTPLATPAGFRVWSALPTRLPFELPYVPADLATRLAAIPLLRESPEPDAFLHEDPSYVQWTPRVHQAPATSTTPPTDA